MERSAPPAPPLRGTVFVLLFALLAPPAPAQIALGGIERQAAQLFEEMKTRIPQSRNPRARQFVQCVAMSLVPQLEPKYANMHWEVVLFAHDAINAFALPGGKVGVFTGMFRAADTPDALAAVIGHEMAHVTLEHPEKRARRRTLTGLAASVASIFFGGGDPIAQNALSDVLSMGAELGLNRPYDREQEIEADVRGLHYMAAAGFDPRAAIELWKRMDALKRGAPPEFLSTHPSSDKRLETLIGELVPTLQRFNAARERGRVPDCL